MRLLVIFGLLGMGSLAHSTEAENRLAQIESRLQAIESAIEKSECKMTYKHHAYRLNICDKGTFVRSVTDVGGRSVQLECGYYQLSCKR